MNVDYRIIYSDRRTIGLTVERDSSVIVHAPMGTPEDKIHQAVRSKSLWLYERVNHQRKYPPKRYRKEFVTGETLMYLGRNYRLEIVDRSVEGVRFDHKFILSRASQPHASEMLRAWYIERAQKRILPLVRSFAESLGVQFNRVLISDLHYRWGSCTPKNNLNFNWRIVKAPLFVIHYIVVHELAHLLEPNHTERFWNIVSVQVPRFEAAKEWLREHGGILEEDL